MIGNPQGKRALGRPRYRCSGYLTTLSVVFFLVSWGGVRLSPLGTSATNWPIVPAPDDNNACGAIGGMRIGRGNLSTRGENLPQCHRVHHKSHMT
jgi:hypothetical protein